MKKGGKRRKGNTVFSQTTLNIWYLSGGVSNKMLFWKTHFPPFLFCSSSHIGLIPSLNKWKFPTTSVAFFSLSNILWKTIRKVMMSDGSMILPKVFNRLNFRSGFQQVFPVNRCLWPLWWNVVPDLPLVLKGMHDSRFWLLEIYIFWLFFSKSFFWKKTLYLFV